MTRPDTLWQRYRNTWQQAWRQRKALDAPVRSTDESEFLPAALALQETPPHPAPRVFLWSIMVFAAIALLWACVGRVDVVAVASGKVVPSGRTKLIQPSEAAVVKAIHVSDGQPVRAGELLLELDPTTAGADVRRGESELLAARIDVARSSAMLQAIASGQAPLGLHGGLEDADASQVQDAERWLHGQYQEFRNNLDQADAEIQRRAAEIEAAQAQVASLRKSLPIVTQLAEDYQNLLGEQYVARHEYLDKHQARLDMERQLKVQQASVRQASA
ncbi:MAG: biotin/lipoyl-binding protein, partial [Pseudomonas farsensis]|uniref:biotin/lipoyl-binding protein n=1 Tax=Pseudomonas farsensis TaxID=2745492 RepID=UPI003C7EBBD4